MLAPKELKDVHPLGKSPVLTDGDKTIAESGAIVGERAFDEIIINIVIFRLDLDLPLNYEHYPVPRIPHNQIWRRQVQTYG